jgi:fucose permease
MAFIEPRASSRPLLLMIAYLGFISLGLPDTLIGVAWPSVRDSFGLQQAAIAMLFVGASCSYFFSSFFTGRALRMMSIGTLLALSSAFVAASGFGYAFLPVWSWFAACSLLHGLGSGAIDAGLNHYAAHHFSARHMNWLHACYSIGATLGPLIMTATITWRGSFRDGYLTVAVVLLVLTVLFAVTRRWWEDGNEGRKEQEQGQERESTVGMRRALKHPLVRLQMVIFFVYTGLEVTLGQWSFTLLTEARGLTTERAGLWVTIYWASIVAGRVLFGFVVDRWGIVRLLRGSMATAVLGTVLFALNPPGALGAVALAITGLGLAAIYPCLMTQTPQRLGKGIAAHAIGFQVSSAMLGAAAMPSTAGFLAQRFGLENVAVFAVVMAVVVGVLHERVLKPGGA